MLEKGSMVPIQFADGTTKQCEVILAFQIKDEKTYLALIPKGETDVLLYRYIAHGEDDIELMNIESDEEWNEAVKEFTYFVSHMEDENQEDQK